MAMPLPIWLPMPLPTTRPIMARMVVRAVIMIGRMRVRPVATRAS